MVTRAFAVCLLLYASVLVSITAVAAEPYLGGTNAWTKTISGFWDEPFWTMEINGRTNHPCPSMTTDWIAFTNANSKVLTIRAGSADGSYCDNLQIRNLLVDAPPGSVNSLLLNYLDPLIPLQVADTLAIGANGTLLSFSSVLTANTLLVDGSSSFFEGSAGRFGTIRVGARQGGQLSIDNSDLSASEILVGGNGSGEVHQNWSFVVARSVLIERGNYFVRGGSELHTSNTVIRATGNSEQITVFENGARMHSAENELFIGPGTLYFLHEHGQVSARHIVLGGELRFYSGAIDNYHGTFTLAGGTFNSDAAWNHSNLGKLRLGDGVSVLKNIGFFAFRDSGDIAWSPSGTLQIMGWSEGYSRIICPGLTEQQLARITFVDPYGMPPGNYAARMHRGDVIPQGAYQLNVVREPGHMVFSWLGTGQLLSSTNVAGPYTAVSDCRFSPCTIPIGTEFQRYFTYGYDPSAW